MLFAVVVVIHYLRQSNKFVHIRFKSFALPLTHADAADAFSRRDGVQPSTGVQGQWLATSYKHFPLFRVIVEGWFCSSLALQVSGERIANVGNDGYLSERNIVQLSCLRHLAMHPPSFTGIFSYFQVGLGNQTGTFQPAFH